MIENNSNPESGIDQFLASQIASDPQTIEELRVALATARGELMVKDQQLASATQQMTQARNSRDNYQAMYDKVQTFIQNSIDNGDWTDEELEEIFWEELSEILDLEIMKTIEVRITAEWTATLKMKRGQDLSDIEISVEEPEISRFASGELSDVYESELTVDER
jgi:uncharacterized coiled-coil protein SlyX